ncbi:hypothetical protein F5I97DRAFT_1933786 [Phlebopus sp. FC_14]|nr:hypothetical protein F5I97DRAFT_1933786 [Phlebopus sp. FC_14]
MEKIIIWIELYRFQGQDNNSFERMNWLVILFEWFHLVMAFANSLHKQYLGNTASHGLMHAFTLLEKKGLNTNLYDTICYVTEAHFRTCWKAVAGVKSLAELQSETKSKCPSQLQALVVDIVKKLVSSETLHHMYAYSDEDLNDILCASIMWNCDALRYVDLDDAIKSEDIGVMEETLLHLLFRFVGGNNSKYTIEVLELLQCWLVNFTGKYHTHMPISKAQEYNIKAVKVGPNAPWDDMKRTKPAIPTLHAVHKYLERQIYTLQCGSSHTDPSQEHDLQTLDNVYQSSDIHARGKSDQVTDICDKW